MRRALVAGLLLVPAAASADRHVVQPGETVEHVARGHGCTVDWARARGTPDDELDAMFQYPHGEDAMTGLVRHWPEHANHFHVRFKPGR